MTWNPPEAPAPPPRPLPEVMIGEPARRARPALIWGVVLLLAGEVAYSLSLMAALARAADQREPLAMSAGTGAGLIFSWMSTALTNSLATLSSGLLVPLAAVLAWTIVTVVRGRRSARALADVGSGLILALSILGWDFAEPVSALVAGFTALALVLAGNSVSARRYFGAS